LVRERVLTARETAIKRQGVANAQLAGQSLREYTALDAASEAFVQAVIKQLALSGRGYDRLMRVSRTIADLAGEVQVSESHIAEAVTYRDNSL